MSINGNYTQVGSQMVQALKTAASSGPGIEQSELKALRDAAVADQDLSAGEAKLLQDLEQATANGTSVQNFQVADFNPSDLSFGQLTLSISENQAKVAPAAELLSQKASESLGESINHMDLARQIPGANKDAPPAHFANNASQIQSQGRILEGLINRAQQLDPPAAETVKQLQQMRDLNTSLGEIQSHWAASTDGGRAEQDVVASLEKIRTAQTLLQQIDPAVIGSENYTRLEAQLKSQAETVGRYAQEYGWGFFENEDLSEFMLRATPQDSSPVPVAEKPVGPPVESTDQYQNFNDLIALPQQLQTEQTEAMARVKGLLTPHLGNAPEVLRQYINNPAQVPESERANVRQAFSDLFEDNPALAGQVSQELTTVQNTIPALRTRLEDQLKRAETHGQTEVVSELKSQLQGLANSESQLVHNWQNQQGLMLEGLSVAAKESDQVRDASAGARDWIEQTQNRYASIQLDVPENRELLAKGFEDSLATEAGAEMREKVASTTAKFGDPISTVPMALVTDGTGETLNFNAYVYKDGDRFMALNPIDRKYYHGDTPEAALAQLGQDSRMVAGQLHFNDGKQMQQFTVQPPEDKTTMTYVMAGLGLAGAAGLMLLPEPTSKVGSVALASASIAMVTSSTYFAVQGATQMNDLIQNDNFGNNRETWMAALDVASGLIGVAGAAGAGARVVTQGTRAGVQSALMQSLSRMGASKTLSAAEFADAGIGVALTAEQIISIHNSSQLSDSEKQAEVAKIVMLSASSMMMGKVLNRNHAQHNLTQQQIQLGHSQQMRSLDMMSTQITGIQTPQGAIAVRDTLTKTLQTYEDQVKSPQMDGNPQLREEALKRIAEVRAQIDQMPAFKTPSQANSDPAYKAENLVGVNNGDGWANSITPDIPSPNQLAAYKGTGRETGAAGFEGENIQGMDIQEIISRIPQEATLRELTPGNSIKEGFEYSWTDAKTQATYTVRLHGADSQAGAGSNAGQGWTARIEREITDPTTGVTQHQQMDGNGQFHNKADSAMNKSERDQLIKLRSDRDKKQGEIDQLNIELAEANAQLQEMATSGTASIEEQQAVQRNKGRIEQRLLRASNNLENLNNLLRPFELKEALTNGVHIPIAGNPAFNGGQP